MSDLSTNGSSRPMSDDEIEIVAADWLALRASGLSPAQEAAFETWLAADRRHARAVAELDSTWRALVKLETYPRPVDAPADPEFFSQPRPRRRSGSPRLHRLAPVAWATAAAIVVSAIYWAKVNSPHSVEGTAIAAVESEASRVLNLSDGSAVELKPGSEVAEQFTVTERRVRLVRGEAHFTVIKNPERPFLFDVSGVVVRAVGTSFNVRFGEAGVEVLVTEGKVSVATPANALLGGPALTEAPILEACQKTIIPITTEASSSVPVVQTLELREIDRLLAWQSSRLVFDAMPLEEVVARFNRHVEGQRLPRLVLADSAAGTIRISGRFRAENIEGFVELLETSFGISVERRGGDILLRKTP